VTSHAFQLALKRLLDVVAAALLLMVMSPVFVVVAACIRFTMGSPIFFRQVRPGLHGRPFRMFKFRTMRDARDANGAPLPDAARVTGVGRFLRKTSIDELPELINVLRGEMSLVGPRPLLMDYLERYTPEQHRRHLMRPGITGLAQVSGRQHLSFSRRIALDVAYVDNWTLALDAKVLAMTLPSVLASRGVVTGQDVRDVDDLAPPPASQDEPGEAR
jgi:lipopolysaccharide/colanic/teichoic acid biosynthesis glycosyltransferase